MHPQWAEQNDDSSTREPIESLENKSSYLSAWPLFRLGLGRRHSIIVGPARATLFGAAPTPPSGPGRHALFRRHQRRARSRAASAARADRRSAHRSPPAGLRCGRRRVCLNWPLEWPFAQQAPGRRPAAHSSRPLAAAYTGRPAQARLGSPRAPLIGVERVKRACGRLRVS